MQTVAYYKKKYPLQFGKDTPVLRTVCADVQHITPAIKELHDGLGELVWEYEGVGLAAPQIGQPIRMAAITQRDTSKKKRELKDQIILINPIIIGQGDEETIEEEGCLSLPGVTGKVSRVDSITIKYMDIKGASHILKADGYNARIILHEMDHLDGVLFVDKLV